MLIGSAISFSQKKKKKQQTQNTQLFFLWFWVLHMGEFQRFYHLNWNMSATEFLKDWK